jgi:DNA recombination protein RmuC
MQIVTIILLSLLIIALIVSVIVLRRKSGVATDNSSLDLLKEQIAEKNGVIAQKDAQIKENLVQIAEEKAKFSAIEQRLISSIEFFEKQKADLAEQKQTLEQKIVELDQTKELLAKAEAKNASLQTEIANLNKLLVEQKEAQEKIVATLKSEFENLATDILKKQSGELSDANRQKLNEILNPLKNDIDSFKKKVEEQQVQNKEQFDIFGERVKTLHENANKISDDASKLAEALKGNKKIQGNWGETILKQILENAGLIEGLNYKLQENVKDEEGDRFIPDCVIYLPDNTSFVIDSKVSLNAYAEYFATEDAEKQKTFAKAHVMAIRKHIDELAAKKYEELKGTLDFVFMFIPIESAYLLAVSEDAELLNYAYKQKVIVVSTTTVMASIKMVDDLWIRQEQDKNVAEIIKRAKMIFDGLVGFAKSLETIGTRIKSTQTAYDDVLNKLTGQRGLIQSADKLNKLGVKARKKLPEKFLEETVEDVDYEESEN